MVAGSSPAGPTKKCPLGGIGRRQGLKIPCPYGRAGSSPAGGTKQKQTSIETHFSEHKKYLEVESVQIQSSDTLDRRGQS